MKHPGIDANARAADLSDKIIVEFKRYFRRCRLVETRPHSLAAITVKSELRDNKQRSLAVYDVAIHLARVVVKYPQTHDLTGEIVGILFAVLTLYAKKYKEAPLDRSGYVSIYFNTRLRDALYDSSH